MNRKNFIKNTSLAGIGAMYMPSFFHKHEVIFGHNNKKYRIDIRWSKADAGRNPVNDCHEMVQDNKGRILLLTNETKNNVLIYDKSGKLLETWGTTYPGAHGLTLFNENGEDVLFICDNNRHQVIKTSIKGQVLMTIDYPKESGAYQSAEEFVPTETAIAPNGDIYIADGYGKDFIIHYDNKGKYIRHFCGRGAEDKHVLNAHGVCVDNRDKNNPCLIVSSRQQQAFKRYSLDGQYLSTITLPGAWVCRPVIKDKHLYAAVLQSNQRPGQSSGFVTILNEHNKVISNLGGSKPTYDASGTLGEMYQTIKAFQYPHDVCIDDEENLYVAQWNSGKVYPYKFEPVL